MKRDLMGTLKERVLLADGAVGTLLFGRGVEMSQCLESLNLTDPDLIRSLHRSYIEAGADIIAANSFGCNRLRLEKHNLDADARQIAKRAAEIAREAAGEDIFVAGSVGPLGALLKPYGDLDSDEAYALFAEPIAGLLEGGADAILVETFIDLEEAKAAVRAARDLHAPAIICQLAFTEEGRTLLGATPASLLSAMEGDALVLGANCGMGPEGMLHFVEDLCSKTQGAISVMPNAGFPQQVEGRIIYLTTPDYFAHYCLQYVEAGANIVGGCCGTTAPHITAARKALDKRERCPVVRRSPQSGVALEKTSAQPENPLLRALQSKFVTTVEIGPPRGAEVSKVVTGASRLKARGVQALNVTDGAMGRVRMSPTAIARLIREKVGLEIILHFTCRDRNLIGLQAELLGAYALGVRNILALTGDPPSLPGVPKVTGVFDVKASGLVRLINQLNRGEDTAGKSIGEATGLSVGVAANPGAGDLELEVKRLRDKIAAGADFIHTQAVFDLDLFDRFLERAEPLGVPILAGVLPLKTSRSAEYLHNEVPGILVPDAIRTRLSNAKTPEAEVEVGIEIARGLLKNLRSRTAGACLMTPTNDFDFILKLLEGVPL